MTNKVILSGIFLLAILLATPTPTVHSSSGESHSDKVMLSLRIAKARKETSKVDRYKSIIRQRKLNRSFANSHPSSAQ